MNIPALIRLPLPSFGVLASALLLPCAPALQAAPPPNDNRANAIVLTGASGRLVASNVDATKEAGEANHAGNAGGKSIWFSITPAANANVRIDTVGTDFDTTMSLYVGSSSTVAAGNDNLSTSIYGAGHGGYTQSRLNLNLTGGTTYLIAVDGWNPGTEAPSGPVVLNWHSVVGAPANDTFANATELTGLSGGIGGRNGLGTKEPGELNHAGDPGGRSVWYKWTPSVSGEAVVDVLGSSFDTLMAVYTGTDVASLTEVGSADDQSSLVYCGRVTFNAVAGTTYYIAVDGWFNTSAGAVSTGSIALHYYLSATPPSNNDFSGAITLTGREGTTNGSTLNATKEAGELPHGGDTGGRSVWYSWTAPGNGMVNFTTMGILWDTLLSAYTGSSLASLVPVTGAESDDVLNGLIQFSRIGFLASSGTVYRIAVDGYSADYGVFNLNWSQAIDAPTNDMFASAMTLEGRSGSATNSNTNASYEQPEPLVSIIGSSIYLSTFGGKSLWYKWTANSSRAVTFDTLGSSIDTTLAVLTGNSLSALTVLTNNDNIVSNNATLSVQSRLTLSNVVVGTTYYIQADGAQYGNYRLPASGTIVLNYSQPGGAPTNDFFTNALVLTGRSGQLSGNTLDATTEPNEPEHATISPYSSVWYRWTATNTYWVTFDTLQNLSLDTVLAAYVGNDIQNLTEVAANDDATPGTIVQSRISFLATAGTTYYIALDGKAPVQGDFTLRWRPTVSLQARQIGNNLTLTVTAAAPGFYALQDSPTLSNPTWVGFDSVTFTDAAGGTTDYDTGPVSQSPRRYFRVVQ